MSQGMTMEEYKAKKQAQEKETFALLEKQTDVDMTDKKSFLDLLNKVSDHTASSVSNVILVQAQKPNATAVTSIVEWEKRNINVSRDENDYYPKGIYQFALDGYYVDDNGEAHAKFKVFKGFDATQTTNPEYARKVIQEERPITVFVGDTSASNIRNVALCNSSPIRCIPYDTNNLIDNAEYISEAVGARYIPATKTIIIRKLSKDEWFQRVAFEIAHGILHKERGSLYSREDCAFEAGVIAYMVSRSAGVSTDKYSFDISHLRSRYQNNADFRSTIEHCQELAHDIAFRLNNKLKEHNAKMCSPKSRQEITINGG